MKKQGSAQVKELLDSDDEFPMEYFEEVITPAYENDHRFDMIQFKWINNATVQGMLQLEKTLRENEKFPIINNGILSTKDLFCLKSLEGYGDSTLIWFINFLIHKDMQSNSDFRRSCLVSNYLSENVFNPEINECLKKSDNLYSVTYKIDI